MKMRIDFCQDKRIIKYVKKQNSLDAVSVRYDDVKRCAEILNER